MVTKEGSPTPYMQDSKNINITFQIFKELQK